MKSTLCVTSLQRLQCFYVWTGPQQAPLLWQLFIVKEEQSHQHVHSLYALVIFHNVHQWEKKKKKLSKYKEYSADTLDYSFVLMEYALKSVLLLNYYKNKTKNTDLADELKIQFLSINTPWMKYGNISRTPTLKQFPNTFNGFTHRVKCSFCGLKHPER